MKILNLLLILIFLLPNTSYAYLDPGSGSLILQALLAASAAVLAFFKKIKNYVKNLFSKKNVKEK
tara:strand:- start:335 stop:529 length:195 start_codon:yes stop_codon:yes gene_type:complete